MNSHDTWTVKEAMAWSGLERHYIAGYASYYKDKVKIEIRRNPRTRNLLPMVVGVDKEAFMNWVIKKKTKKPPKIKQKTLGPWDWL